MLEQKEAMKAEEKQVETRLEKDIVNDR
jgi:hypothetical protein